MDINTLTKTQTQHLRTDRVLNHSSIIGFPLLCFYLQTRKSTGAKSPNPLSQRKPETSYVTEAYCGEEGLDDTAWVFDTAASTHFCRRRDFFTDFEETKGQQMTVAVYGVSCPIKGKGTVTLIFGQETIILTNVLYSPYLKRNLLSGPRFDEGGAKFVGENGKIVVFHHTGRKHFTAQKNNGLYFVYPEYPSKLEENFTCLSQSDVADIWHKRLAHINVQHIVNTSKLGCVKGLPVLSGKFSKCEPCKEAKARRVSFKPISEARSQKPLELIHMDLCGPLPKMSRQSHKYFLTIIDDYSKKVVAFPLKNKSEVFNAFERFQKRAERFLDRKIICVRTDNGLEFCNERFKTHFEKQGIRHERTNAYTPEENGVCERYNYTAVDGIKVLLRDSGLSEGFWADALLHFVYTWNRVCHKGQLKTPFELYGGKEPSIKHLRPFGTKAYVGIPKQLRRKLDMRAKKGILIGYAQQTKGYRIWLPQEKKVVETINVRFEESSLPNTISENNGHSDRVEAVLDPLYKIPYEKELDSDSDDESVTGDITGERVVETPTELLKEQVEGQLSTISEDIESSDKSDPIGKPDAPAEVVWIRKAVTRPDESRTDIYYYEQGKTERLRSINDVKKYCAKHNIRYNPSIFNFKGSDKFTGIVKDDGFESSSYTSA